jgi:hypothetical protein
LPLSCKPIDCVQPFCKQGKILIVIKRSFRKSFIEFNQINSFPFL